MSTNVYSDGGCDPNPGPGGWGVVIKAPGGDVELCGGEASTTNNRMELLAAIRALEHFPEGAEIHVHSDSQYVIKSMTEWLSGWKRRGWRNAANEPVKNVDLVKALDALASRRRVRWTWVRGHAGDRDNERADRLVAEGRAPFKKGGAAPGPVGASPPSPPTAGPPGPRTTPVPLDMAIGLRVSRAARDRGQTAQAFVEAAVLDALARHEGATSGT